MPMFSPEPEYTSVRKNIPIKDFHDYKEEFVVRPPYQRKTVWSNRKQQALLDSLFRGYYVPRIVIREVRLSEDQTLYEVIDGQQRIITVQRFIYGELTLPTSLSDIHKKLPGSHYSELPSEIRRFVDRDLIFIADLIKGIDRPNEPSHQKIATEIFWRLQQGESLNYMEVAHSRLSSLARNFVVKYSDDQRFDYFQYKPIDENPDKHPFFSIIARNNDRMQHLALLTRMLIIEDNDGPTDIRDVNIRDYIDDYQEQDGIGNWELENRQHAKQLIWNLSIFYEVFKNDPMLKESGVIQELSIEYFIISLYLLLRHLIKYYVFDSVEQDLFHDFVSDFHMRWRSHKKGDDTDILIFSDNRQQSATDIEVRDRILRQAFFEFLVKREHKLLTKDDRRAFNEADRIMIYRMDNGMCQDCLEEGKPEKECVVSWQQFEADHVIPHSKGGLTVIENAQVLCQYHNKIKSDHFENN